MIEICQEKMDVTFSASVKKRWMSPFQLLVTYNNYSLAPGAILWDFIPTWEEVFEDAAKAALFGLVALGNAIAVQNQAIAQAQAIRNAVQLGQFGIKAIAAEEDADAVGAVIAD
jgi:hypothetical protein